MCIRDRLTGSDTRGVFTADASYLAVAYEEAGLTELETPPEALVVSVDDGVGGNVDPGATAWLQPIVTSYDATDGLIIKLNGSVADASPIDIEIGAQRFEAGSDSEPMSTVLAGVTLIQVDGAEGTYKIGASDLARVLDEAEVSGANALTVKVSDGDSDYDSDASSVVWLKEVLVDYNAEDEGLVIQLTGDLTYHTDSTITVMAVNGASQVSCP